MIGAGCWAHVRRKFYDIDKVQPDGFAHEVLEAIASLYGIEKSIKGQSAQERCQVRQARAGPILQQLQTRLRKVKNTHRTPTLNSANVTRFAVTDFEFKTWTAIVSCAAVKIYVRILSKY